MCWRNERPALPHGRATAPAAIGFRKARGRVPASGAPVPEISSSCKSCQFCLPLRSPIKMSTQTIESETAREIISYDPATGEEIGRAPLAGGRDVRDALKRARAAQPAWAGLSFRERGQVILRARKIVLAQLEEIGRLISRETGKPVAEAIS